MFFYIKFKYPPITQRQTPSPNYNSFSLPSILAASPQPTPNLARPLALGPLAAYMAILPLNSWQFYHFSSGCAAASKLKTYMLIPT